MDETHAELVRQFYEEAVRDLRKAGPLPPPALMPKTIHYSELPPGRPGSELQTEWDAYRREVGRLLADGHEGRAVLIKGDEVVGVWDTMEEARTAGSTRYPQQPHLVHEIHEHEPLLQLSWRFWNWPA